MLVALIWLGLSAPEPRAPTGAAPGNGATTPQPAGASGTPGAGSLVQLPPLPTGGPTAGPSPAPTSAPPTATVPVQGVNVEVRTVDRVWVRATVDGRVVNEETYAAGQTVRWTGQQSVLFGWGTAPGWTSPSTGSGSGLWGRPGSPSTASSEGKYFSLWGPPLRSQAPDPPGVLPAPGRPGSIGGG